MEDRPTPTLLPDPDHDHGATAGAQGGIMGDVYNSANNDMPITIAQRYGITISRFLQQNLEQHPKLRVKSKLKQ